MPDDILQQFAQHLHRLIQQHVAAKPGPFRLIELAPTLLKTETDQAPALVFWANRESFFAGGLLYLPRTVSDTSLAQGKQLTRALGLNSFHTWDAAEIAAWSVDPDKAHPLWTSAVPAADLNSPESLRIVIGQLLADIQQRFFNEQLNLPRLSEAYLANLLQLAFDELLAELPVVNPKIASRQQLIDSLLRRLVQILALAAEGTLPRVTSVEALIEQLDAATGNLPAALASSLSFPHDPVSFHGSAARRLQHLTVRLSQLGQELRPLLANALEILQPLWAKQLQHYPAPPLPEGDAQLLLLFAESIPDEELCVAQIGNHGLLAAHALLRHLRGLPLPSLQLYDPLRLTPPHATGRIAGTLTGTLRPAAADLQMLKARLRCSWPNRNLTLATSAPRWHWHLLHLAGLLAPPARLNLALPADWLTDKHSETLYTLLSERLELCSVTAVDEAWHHVSWSTEIDNTSTHLISRDGKESTLQTEGNPPLALLRLRLLLPAPLARLVERGELQLYDDIAPLSATAVRLFLRSTPGKTLWRLLSGKATLPGEERLLAACRTYGVPLPRPEMLTALAKLARQTPAPTSLPIDHAVADWLGDACLDVASVVPSATAGKQENGSDADALIITEATGDGILRFPEDFLYDVPESQRLHFAATLPLHMVDSFFGNITLESATGERIEVEGEATARALVLATSLGERPLALPSANRQTEGILERYANHLHQLRTALETTAAAHNPDRIQDTVNRIWSDLPVPPWDLLRHHLPQATKVVV